MRRLLSVLALCVAPAAAIAGDEQPATPPPTVPPPGLLRPAAAAAPIDEERLAALIDRAVDRALERRLAARAGGPVGGWTPPPSASPQSALAPPARVVRRIVPAEPVRRIATVPAWSEDRQYVRVLVPAPLHRRAIAAVGEKMVRCGQARTKTMRVAPATVATCTEAAPAPVVYPSAQAD